MKAKKKVAKVKKASPRRKVSAPKTPRRVTKKASASAEEAVTEFATEAPIEPAAAARPKVARRQGVRRKVPVKLPPILLEGDSPLPPQSSGPGEKYALGPRPPAPSFTAAPEELPEAYGTRKLFLTARDPHWLYANWDLTREQLLQYNRQSVDGHLVVRVFFTSPDVELAGEMHVHPESRHWFVYVERAAAKYTAELGFYDAQRQWNSIAKSGATLTPPESPARGSGVQFATIPPEVSFAELLALVQAAAQAHQPLAQAIEGLRREGHPELPAIVPEPSMEWTPAQAQALAQVVSVDQVHRVWIGSLEITEVLRRQWEQEISSQGAARFAQPGLPSAPRGAVTSVTSPFGGQEKAGGKGFWFNVNAELIIYGATERDASVTIGGRKIKLRHDGSFSYRFALPDGAYELPVVARSADGTDGRAAGLKFSRATEIRGEVGTHPQDPALKPPRPEHV